VAIGYLLRIDQPTVHSINGQRLDRRGHTRADGVLSADCSHGSPVQPPGATGHSKFGLGRAIGIDTIGEALAPLIPGVLLLPAMGAKLALLLVSLGCLVLLPDRCRQSLRLATVAVIISAALAFMPPLRFNSNPG
jgi:hypothetical protein